MAGSGDDPMGPVCYSELLFGDDVPGLDTDACTFGFSAASFSDAGGGDNSNAPKMLCFGDYADGNLEPDRKSGPKPKPEPTPKKKRSDASRVGKPGTDSGAPGGNRRSGKKQKGGKCTAGGNGKVVKKEKLGERITALQQLVSPFGKTDTASVLHEALGYIRFLQDQVQVLCSPYLHPSTSSAHRPPLPEEGLMRQGKGVDLRSRGLCLVPVELTVHVTETNGADLWTSAAMLDSVCTI